MTRDLRMNAYYYSFEPTGQRSIDRILSAVACAGKAYHNTSDWTEDRDWQGNPQEPHPEFGGASPADWIQNAANDAAAALASPPAPPATTEPVAPDGDEFVREVVSAYDIEPEDAAALHEMARRAEVARIDVRDIQEILGADMARANSLPLPTPSRPMGLTAQGVYALVQEARAHRRAAAPPAPALVALVERYQAAQAANLKACNSGSEPNYRDVVDSHAALLAWTPDAPTLTVEKLTELLEFQRGALDAHRWAMPKEADVTPADEALWTATQTAVHALEEAVHLMRGYPERPFTRASLALAGCPSPEATPAQEFVPASVLEGVTVAGARAFWRAKDVEAAHEALRADVMTIASDPHLSWDEARSRLWKALATPEPPAVAQADKEELMTDQAKCEMCGEPMPPGEEMFKFHGYSGPCPVPIKIASMHECCGDGATLRGYIKTHGETPAMTASNRDHWKRRAEAAEDITRRIPANVQDIADGLADFLEHSGALHDDECPGDDTCACSYVRENTFANAAARLLHRLAVDDADDPPAVAQAARKCPTCDSPDPKLHPAMQFEGEVQTCRDAWHGPAQAAPAQETPK